MFDILGSLQAFYVSARGIFRRQTAPMENVELFIREAYPAAVANGAAQYAKLITIIAGKQKEVEKETAKDPKNESKISQLQNEITKLEAVKTELQTRLNLHSSATTEEQTYTRFIEYVLEQTERRDDDLKDFAEIIDLLQAIKVAQGVRLSRFARTHTLPPQVIDKLNNLLKGLKPHNAKEDSVESEKTPLRKDSMESTLSDDKQASLTYETIIDEQIADLINALPQEDLEVSPYLRERLDRLLVLRANLNISAWLDDYYRRFDIKLAQTKRQEVIALIEDLTPQEKLEYLQDEVKAAERIGYVKTNRFALSVFGISLVVGFGVLIPASALPAFASAFLAIFSVAWVPPVWIAAVTGVSIAIFAFAVAYWYNSTRTHTEYSDRHQRIWQKMNSQNDSEVKGIVKPRPASGLSLEGELVPFPSSLSEPPPEKISSKLARIAGPEVEQELQTQLGEQEASKAIGTPHKPKRVPSSMAQMLNRMPAGTVFDFPAQDVKFEMAEGHIKITVNRTDDVAMQLPSSPLFARTEEVLAPAPSVSDASSSVSSELHLPAVDPSSGIL